MQDLKDETIASAPLLRAVERSGGIIAVIARNGIETHTTEVGPLRVGKTGRKRRTRTVETPIVRRWKSRLEQAEKAGHFRLLDADELCCDLLGVHPMQVYGWAWLDGAEDDGEPVEVSHPLDIEMLADAA